MRTVIGNIACREMMLDTRVPDIKLYARNKYLADRRGFGAERTVLYIHGATFPSETAFDFRLDGVSWMDYIALHGYDVWLLDVRGYGRSSWPAEMYDEPHKHAPLVRGETALEDMQTVIEFIRRDRGVNSITLIGWSRGAVLAAAYTVRHRDHVNGLVFYAPIWTHVLDAPVAPRPESLGAYRLVEADYISERWHAAVPNSDRDEVIDETWCRSWIDTTWSTGKVRGDHEVKHLRVPNGLVQDGLDYEWAGHSYYDPAQIRVPSFLVAAEWDRTATPKKVRSLCGALVNAPFRQYVKVQRGSHWLMLERNRFELFRYVQQFLEQRGLYC